MDALSRGVARRRRVIAVVHLALLSALASPATAQLRAPVPEYVREHWTVADGLPINTVTAVVQTRDGYLWLGTNDGVVRFDGVRFTVFNAGNTPGLPSNRVSSLLEDRAGALWIMTEQGHVVRYLHGVFTLVDGERGLRRIGLRLSEMPDGALVLATTRGAGLIEGTHYTPFVAGPAADSLAMDVNGGEAVRRRDGSAWIATLRQGLWRSAGGRLTDVTPAALRGVPMLGVALDTKDRLWLSSANGVWIEDGGFREVRSREGPLRAVVAFRWDARRDRMRLMGSDGVYASDGREATTIWEVGKGASLMMSPFSLDLAGTGWYASGPSLYHDGRLADQLNSTATDNPTSSDITSIAIDREGSVWLGTRASGLFRLKPSLFSMIGMREGLQSGNVYPVYEDPWGSVWLGALVLGVSRIDRGDGAARVTRFLPTPITTYRDGRAVNLVYDHPPNPRDFLSDRPDRLWVAALDGIHSCTIPDFRCARDTASALADYVAVHALHADAQARLWAGTANGVLRRDDERWLPVAGWPLTGIQVRAFVNTPDGALWMATGGGGIVRHKEGRFMRVSAADGLPSDVVRALHVDSDGYLWVGSEGRGMARLDPRAWSDSTRDRRIVQIGTRNGLYDDAIHRILADDADRLWMNTNRGIFWVPRAELVAFADGRVREVHSTAYTERDGLRNREGNGGVGSAGMRTRDGRLWFPTQGGVAIVDPRAVTARRVAPPAIVERITVGDSAIVPSNTPIELGVAHRDLTIEYTALSLLDPKNLRFRYRLEPYDADWVDAGSRRTAFYTRVPPGTYTFQVQAVSPDAEFGAPSGGLPISLAFQPWERRTVRFGGVVLLLAAIAGLTVLYVRRVRRQAEHLEMIVAERTATLREREQQLARQNVQLSELDRAKSRFFANVSHEFRTPLTLTIGPLEDVVGTLDGAEGTNGRVGRALDMALRNARRLMRLVNQILDVAKLEAGQMRLSRRPLDLADFVRGIAEAFAPAASGKGIVLDLEAPASVRGAFDSDALEKIVTNLLSNAVKFTPGGGRITVSLLQHDASVTLRVADTGPGIPPEHLPHVFERFYQVDESLTRSQAGTGIGLALVHELVTLHGGTLAVSSGDLAPGAVFTVVLPLGEPDADTDERRAVVVDDSAGSHDARRDEEPIDADGAHDESHDVPTLLIVDDSADLRTYVREHFAPRFRVREAANGAAGVEVARRVLPDIVISDLMMPESDGHMLVRALRASPETEFLPIVLLTAHTSMEQRLEGLSGGADDYLTKPFDMRELSARVDNLIAQRRRLRDRYTATAPALPRGPELAVVAAAADGATASVAVRPAPGLAQTDQAFVAKVERAIAEHLADPDFGVAEFARAVAQDRTYLFRRTRQLFGESPSELIRRARLRRGATLLADTDERVADIAYAVGFNSVSYFSQCFLAAYGVTPTVFRQRASES